MSKVHYQSYEEMVRIATTYYKDKGFCSVIGVAVTAGVGYGKAYHALRRAGRKHGCGAYFHHIQNALRELGQEPQVIRGYEGRQIKTMKRELTQGRFLVFVRGHVAAIRDGQSLDWTENRAHRVIQVWKVQ